MKYQFSIRTSKKGDKNSAASKAVLDCTELFNRQGYADHNLVFEETTSKTLYYASVFWQLFRFYTKLKKGSIVGIQYPMLNNVFKYFIRAARRKGIRFFCIIHDIESLRAGETDEAVIRKEVTNFNYYDAIIVHNQEMLSWLKKYGATVSMIPLGVFDYLADALPVNTVPGFSHSVAFAGNLAKSKFIYGLDQIAGWTFNLYGPNFNSEKNNGENVQWKGEFSPDEIVRKLDGNFGLIWDGEETGSCKGSIGEYLRFNNPHKFSLYLAAGLPVIAPAHAAIGHLIREKGLGILVNSLADLSNLEISSEQYREMAANCLEIRKDIINGRLFLNALAEAERQLAEA